MEIDPSSHLIKSSRMYINIINIDVSISCGNLSQLDIFQVFQKLSISVIIYSSVRISLNSIQIYFHSIFNKIKCNRNIFPYIFPIGNLTNVHHKSISNSFEILHIENFLILIVYKSQQVHRIYQIGSEPKSNRNLIMSCYSSSRNI